MIFFYLADHVTWIMHILFFLVDHSSVFLQFPLNSDCSYDPS